MKRLFSDSANYASDAVGAVRFPSNMDYLAILADRSDVIWEGPAYSIDDVPEEYRNLKVIDKYRAGDPDDPDSGESYVVVVRMKEIPDNEVVCLQNTWIYFKTNMPDAESAFHELLDVAASVGIEIQTNNVVLRDSEGDDIDTCEGNA